MLLGAAVQFCLVKRVGFLLGIMVLGEPVNQGPLLALWPKKTCAECSGAIMHKTLATARPSVRLLLFVLCDVLKATGISHGHCGCGKEGGLPFAFLHNQ
jgi:hypothetical protein